MKLAQQQALMARWVLESGAAGVPDGLAPMKDLSAAGGAALYRDSILEVEVRALMITFPIILDLVGEDYFRASAKRYLRGADAQKYAGNLDRVGEGFPAFLPSMDGAKATPYLADVAHMELAIEAATGGADTVAPDEETLKLLAGDPSKIHCALCPNATLLESRYPIDEIFAAWRNGFSEELDISRATQATRIIVWRPDDAVRVSGLSPDEWALLRAIEAESSFLKAVERAASSQPDIDIAKATGKAVTNRWLHASAI